MEPIGHPRNNILYGQLSSSIQNYCVFKLTNMIKKTLDNNITKDKINYLALKVSYNRGRRSSTRKRDTVKSKNWI